MGGMVYPAQILYTSITTAFVPAGAPKPLASWRLLEAFRETRRIGRFHPRSRGERKAACARPLYKKGAMVPIEPFFAHQHAAAEREKARRREEEETMTGYRPDELSGDWQFKIVKGTFKTYRQIELVIQEQAEYGWTLVEIFDQSRMRFKRPATEAACVTARSCGESRSRRASTAV